MVWVLFISSLFTVAVSMIMGSLAGDLFAVEETLPTSYIMIWRLAKEMDVLVVSAMKLRQMLE
ncbi:hypothetical protein ACFLVM_02525 [Chloroflexota bacterium]